MSKTLAEELAEKYTQEFASATNPEIKLRFAYEGNVVKAINEALERAAQECDAYAARCNDWEPGQHAASACFFVAMRIRALAGDPPKEQP